MKQKVFDGFCKIFGNTDQVQLFFAPGRVNLIGEHTDYNGGYVFPCALTIGTYAAARRTDTNQIRVCSLNFENVGIISIDSKNITYDKTNNFGNYPFGVISILQKEGFLMEGGLDICFYGNIPNSSGLSSSASVEVLTAFIASELYHLNLDFVTIAKLCQQAENQFVGVNCGIMDQFAIAMGKENNAIFLDTSDLSYEYAPIVLGDAKIVIACSNKKRGLGDSKYNERRSECENALARLQTVAKIDTLGDLTNEKFEQIKSVIGDETLIRRAKHAVYENQRTMEAVVALMANDLTRFGKLMIESHNSLRDDYEVTGIELDTLVEEALKQPGVIGSRMTGAGFGGCTVSIVKEKNVDSFIEKVGKAYEDKIGYAADFYVVSVGGGPCML